MKSPIPNPGEQLQFLRRKSHEWLSAIQQSSLTRVEALAAFDTMWFPSLSYGLGTTNLSHNQLNQIQKPVVNHILPAMGYNRHFPRAIVYGSRRFAGLSLKHLYSDQGIKHVLQLIKYYRADNSVGRLMKISIRWLRLIAGTSFCPLSNPYYNFQYIDHPWFCTTLRFLKETKASLETDDPLQYLSRVDDSCLMEDFQLSDPTLAELVHLNRCRLYLRVLTLSDIVTDHQIRRECWTGRQPQPSLFLWPRQA